MEDIISTYNLDARFLKFTLNIKTYKKFEGFLSKLVLRKTLLKNNWYSIKKLKKKKKTRIIDNWYSIFYSLLTWIILEIKTLLQKNLQTANGVIDY